MKRTLEQMKSLYPIGTKVAFDRGLDRLVLGAVSDYCRVPDGYTAEDDSWTLRVQDLEFPEYKYTVVPGMDKFKAYYNENQVMKDHKNRYFL